MPPKHPAAFFYLTPFATMRASPPNSNFRRLFILEGKLHPVWRVMLYLGLGLTGTLTFQVAIGLAYTLVRVIAGSEALSVAAEMAGGDIPPSLLFLITLAGLLWTLTLTWAFRRWLDKAPFRDLGFARGAFWKEAAIGLGIGLASMIVVLLIQLVLRWASLTLAAGAAAPGALASTALALLPAAATEEIVFRGYVLQTLESWRGWRLGVIVSSILFGLAHAVNPHVGLLALTNIAAAGVVFCLAYRLTRRLWLPVAYHFMWNYAQGPVFGFPVSGMDFGAAAQTTVTGPALWTGGAFGPEGGLLVTLVLVVTGLGLWSVIKSRHGGQAHPPR